MAENTEYIGDVCACLAVAATYTRDSIIGVFIDAGPRKPLPKHFEYAARAAAYVGSSVPIIELPLRTGDDTMFR